METYKIAAITPDKDGLVNLWTRDGNIVPIRIPVSRQHLVERGTKLRVFHNRAGQVAAYSLDDCIILSDFPKDYKSIKRFLDGFKGIYNLSLDSLRFKYRLNRSLREIGMIPSRDSRTNLMLYKYCQDLYLAR